MTDPNDVLTKALCARIGAEYAPLAPRGAPWPDRMRGFEGFGPIGRAKQGRLDYLFVRRSGNFGNNIIQMIHALTLAERFGIPRIVHNTPWIADGRQRGGPRLIQRGRRLGPRRTGLSGAYFLAKNIEALRDAPPERFLRIARSCLRPALTLSPALAAEGETGIICLNLRGGRDVFENPTPNPNYGQPPLSFYQMGLNTILEIHGPAPIEIVHQDDRNPVLAPLIRWLEAEGHDFRAISAGPEGDARAILAARHVISGWTSFTASLALLSPRIESLTVFRRVHMRDILRLSLPHLYMVRDKENGYFPKSDWRNLADQREMMVGYPETALTVTDIAEHHGPRREAWAGYRLRRAARWRKLFMPGRSRP